jgi:hypothetical protein
MSILRRAANDLNAMAAGRVLYAIGESGGADLHFPAYRRTVKTWVISTY